jgi:hypothetical protein
VVKQQVFCCEISVGSKVSSACSEASLESGNQIVARNMPKKLQAKIYECKSLTLGMRHFVDDFGVVHFL